MYRSFVTLIELTTTVKIPNGAIASMKLSAHPTDRLKNCFVTCSPNNVRRGAKSLKRLLANSSPGKSVADAFGADDVFDEAIFGGQKCKF